jgi:hypothetical protein
MSKHASTHWNSSKGPEFRIGRRRCKNGRGLELRTEEENQDIGMIIDKIRLIEGDADDGGGVVDEDTGTVGGEDIDMKRVTMIDEDTVDEIHEVVAMIDQSLTVSDD